MCNASYSGRLKPAWANSSRDFISNKPITKRADGVAQGVSPEFKPQYCNKTKQNQTHTHTQTPKQTNKQTKNPKNFYASKGTVMKVKR
jgi:hypothetical protein